MIPMTTLVFALAPTPRPAPTQAPSRRRRNLRP